MHVYMRVNVCTHVCVCGRMRLEVHEGADKRARYVSKCRRLNFLSISSILFPAIGPVAYVMVSLLQKEKF